MNDEFVKIRFRLDPKEWHRSTNEGLWASPVEDANLGTAFQLMNSPFFVYGVSFLDTVRATRPSDHGPGLEFEGVIARSGHSTYMILIPSGSPDFAKYWKPLQDLGCTYEFTIMDFPIRGKDKLYSVDVPDTSDVSAVYSLLEDGERNNVWEFQEGHYGHKPRR
jgi:hypothetical protein